MSGRRWVLLGALLAAWAGAGCFPDMPTLPRLLPIDGDVPDEDMDGLRPDAVVDMGEDPIDEGPDEGASEACNGRDDDGDGRVDEGFVGLGEPCAVGDGACRAEGMQACTPDGRGVMCDAQRGMPSPERCNDIDDDCNGVVDEGFEQVDEDCVVGTGICSAAGQWRCTGDGAGVECSATPGPADDAERCNDLDDDCDGETDEGLLRGCEVDNSAPVCRPGTATCVGGAWTACTPLVEPGSRPDVCNGLDDDCDGRIDEEVLSGGIGDVCDCRDMGLVCLGDVIEGCVPVDGYAEQCDPDDAEATVCAPFPERRCDGADENCDGVVDGNGVCDPVVATQCAVWLGWTTRDLPSPIDDWGDCEALGGLGDDISCNRTRAVGRFATLDLAPGADLDETGDRLGVALRCGADPVAAYVANRCRVFIGVATPDTAPGDGADAWGPCPAMPAGGGEGIACAGSEPGGGFRPMPIPFDLTTDALLAVAFKCDDPADPRRAAAMERTMEVSLAWVDAAYGEADPPFHEMCVPGGDGNPYSACATTTGDGRFRAMRLTADVGAGDRFALRVRPVER